MKRLFAISFILFSVQTLFAQRLQGPLWAQGNQRSFVGVYGYGSAVSTGLTNKFASELLFSDQLSVEGRSDQLNRLGEKSILAGGDYSLAIQGALNLKGGSMALLFSMSDEAFAEARFKRDAFKLAFNGNKSFAGDTVFIDDHSFRIGRFQKIGFGWSYQPSLETSYAVMLSFVNGESVLDARVNDSWIYTSLLGDTLQANAQTSLFLSDTANQGFLKHNGAGFMLDFYVEQHFEVLDQQWKASAMIMNVGAVQWRPNTERYALDTTIVFSGIAVDDFNTVQEQVSAEALQDSLMQPIRDGYSRGSVNQFLPGWFQMHIQQQRARGFVMGLGFSARLQSLAGNYGYIAPGFRFNERVGLDAEIGYGGFGSFQAGVSGTVHYARWRAQLRLGNLEAFAAPNRFGGITAAGGFQYFFGL
ncbi:MAG: DUF5723 family protein [Salibacteraceae bacterium]